MLHEAFVGKWASVMKSNSEGAYRNIKKEFIKQVQSVLNEELFQQAFASYITRHDESKDDVIERFFTELQGTLQHDKTFSMLLNYKPSSAQHTDFEAKVSRTVLQQFISHGDVIVTPTVIDLPWKVHQFRSPAKYNRNTIDTRHIPFTIFTKKFNTLTLPLAYLKSDHNVLGTTAIGVQLIGVPVAKKIKSMDTTVSDEQFVITNLLSAARLIQEFWHEKKSLDKIY